MRAAVGVPEPSGPTAAPVLPPHPAQASLAATAASFYTRSAQSDVEVMPELEVKVDSRALSQEAKGFILAETLVDSGCFRVSDRKFSAGSHSVL